MSPSQQDQGVDTPLGAISSLSDVQLVQKIQEVQDTPCQCAAAHTGNGKAAPALSIKPKLTGDRCECPTCGDRFNSTAAFDEHRVGRYGVNRRCLSADDMAAEGMRLRADGFWTTSLKSAGKFGVKDAVLSKAVTQNSRDREGGGTTLPTLPVNGSFDRRLSSGA